MAVTLEQVNILLQRHQLLESSASMVAFRFPLPHASQMRVPPGCRWSPGAAHRNQVLKTFREMGVRRTNVQKNIGDTR